MVCVWNIFFFFFSKEDDDDDEGELDKTNSSGPLMSETDDDSQMSKKDVRLLLRI